MTNRNYNTEKNWITENPKLADVYLILPTINLEKSKEQEYITKARI